jgi:chromate reductase
MPAQSSSPPPVRPAQPVEPIGTASTRRGPRQAPARTQSIFGLSGSLRRGSYNRRLLAAAGSALPPSAQLTIFEWLKEVPPFDEDDEQTPAAVVHELRAQIERADAVLIATPEYNGSLPGQLKNALDWASRPHKTNVLRGKLVVVIGASPSPGGSAHANADARRILTRIGAQVSDQTLLVPRAFSQLQDDGTPADRHLALQLADVASALTGAAKRTPARGPRVKRRQPSKSAA